MFTLLRVVWEVFTAAPLPTLGVVWWAASRHAARAKMPWAWLGPLAVSVWLWRNRRDLRGVVVAASVGFLALLWAGLLWSSPGLRFAVGLAVPAGCAAAGWVWLVSNYPTLPPVLAVQVAVAERRHREVLSDAVHASAGEGARVASLKPLEGGQFEAEIIGPAGVSHADLLDMLRASLAESILSQSGREMRHVAVVGDGAKGRVRVRCSTVSPYETRLGLGDL